MRLAIKFPHLLVPACNPQVAEVMVSPGGTVEPGTPLLRMQCEEETLWFTSESHGEITDSRVEAGDVLSPGVLLFWMECSSPGALPTPAASAVGAAASLPALPFSPSPLLLSADRCRLLSLNGTANSKVHPGTMLVKYSCGPLLLMQHAKEGARLGRELIAPGAVLTPGAPLFELLDAAHPGNSPKPAAPAPPVRKQLKRVGVAGYRATLSGIESGIEALLKITTGLKLIANSESLKRDWDRAVEGRFRVAVIGEFKIGKSTFLNALARCSILPHDVLPCTAVPVRFIYGPRPTLTLYRESGPDEAVQLNSLDDVAPRLQQLATGTELEHDVQEIAVTLPLEICRTGVELMDTPGITESDAMSRITFGVIPKSDAIIFLFKPESPMSGTEKRALQDHIAAIDARRLIFVLNAKDRMQPKDLLKVENCIVSRIQDALKDAGVESPRLFSVSSTAELASDATSGFAALRAELDRFFFEERGELLLSALLRSAWASVNASRGVLQLERRRHEIGQESVERAKSELLTHRKDLQRKATLIRASILETKVRVENAAMPLIAQLQLGLMGLADTLAESAPLPEWIDRETTALKHDLAAHIDKGISVEFQRSYSLLKALAQSEYAPLQNAIAEFLDSGSRATRDVMARLSGLDEAAGESQAPATLNFRGLRISLQFLWISVNLPLAMLTTRKLADAAKALGANEMSASLRLEAIASLRANLRSEIRSQIAFRASESLLQARILPDLGRPFMELILQLNTEVQNLLAAIDENLVRLDSRQDESAGSDIAELESALDTISSSLNALSAEPLAFLH